MKPTPLHSKPRQESLIRALVFTVNIAFVLCRPASHGVLTNSSTHYHHVSHHLRKASHVLKNMANFGDALIHVAKPSPMDDNPSDLSQVSLNRLTYNAHPVDVYDTSQVNDSDHYVFIAGNILVDADDVTRTIHDDVYYDVEEEDVVNEEQASRRSTQQREGMDVNEGPSSIDEFTSNRISSSNRNLKRRQRSSPSWRHRRRHKLLLRTKDGGKSHSTESHQQGSGQRRRDRFLLKSDGPGHVIFKADEVKKDWCRTIPFEQNVTSGKCSKVVRNNLCYGQCNSFFIPQSGRNANKVAFQSCAFCRPQRFRWMNVTLTCPGRQHQKVQKTIMKVESCRCIAADKNEVDKNLTYLRKGPKDRSSRLSH